MKRTYLFFTALLVPIDYFMLVLAGVAAYFLRTSNLIAQWRPVLFNIDLTFERYLAIVLLAALFWVIVFAFNGLYRLRRWRMLEEFFRIISGTSAGLMIIIIYIFVSGQLFNSRFIILAAWLLAIFFVALGRFFVRAVQKYLLFSFGYGMKSIIVIGDDGITLDVIQDIDSAPELGFRIIGILPKLDLVGVKKIISETQVDEILLGEISYPNGQILELIDFCQEKLIDFKFIPNLFQAATTNIEVNALSGVPIVELRRTALGGWGRIIKRLVDVILAIILLIIFLPIMAIIALAIKLDSAGPVIYKNLRVGPKKNFKTYKFRSFYLKYCTGDEYPNCKDASKFEDELRKEKSLRSGPVFKIGEDPRRTKAGKFLERWSLDELPQFFNVLKGEMSLVGPRPHMPKEVAGYQKHHKKVFNIKPGITGLAQISGRSDLEFDEEAKLDIYYIENWSLGMDFKIMLKTPFVALFGKHKS